MRIPEFRLTRTRSFGLGDQTCLPQLSRIQMLQAGVHHMLFPNMVGLVVESEILGSFAKPPSWSEVQSLIVSHFRGCRLTPVSWKQLRRRWLGVSVQSQVD